MCCKWCSFAFIAYYLYIQSTQNIPPTNCFTLSLLATICDKVCYKYQEKKNNDAGLDKRLSHYLARSALTLFLRQILYDILQETASLLHFEMIYYVCIRFSNAPLQLVQAYTSLFSLAFLLKLVKTLSTNFPLFDAVEYAVAA